MPVHLGAGQCVQMKQHAHIHTTQSHTRIQGRLSATLMYLLIATTLTASPPAAASRVAGLLLWCAWDVGGVWMGLGTWDALWCESALVMGALLDSHELLLVDAACARLLAVGNAQCSWWECSVAVGVLWDVAVWKEECSLLDSMMRAECVTYVRSVDALC